MTKVSRSMSRNLTYALALLVLSSACEKKNEPATPPVTLPAAAAATDLAKRGKIAYMNYCIACHASDPAKDGALGPAVAGSSSELLRSRVLDATYPEGYQPKRPTRIMQKMPHVEADLEALHVFLNQT